MFTSDYEIVKQCIAKKRQVVFKMTADLELFCQLIREEGVSLIVDFQTTLSNEEVAINFSVDETITVEKIFVRNTKYEKSFNFLSDTCKQECCRQAQLGYLRHLCNTHELLGKIYVVMHNIGQILRLLE